MAARGRVVSDRGLIAAIIVFLVGGALYLYTRAHAEDFARGPRRAFLAGVPFAPFGEVARDWTAPDFLVPPTAASCTPVRKHTDTPLAPLVITSTGEFVIPFDEFGQEPRGTAAWEQDLMGSIGFDRHVQANFGRSPSPRVVVAVIDQAAPLGRVLPYLRVAAAHDVVEVVIATRLSTVEPTRTLGDVRVDKLCALGSLRLDAGYRSIEGLATWGDLARVVAGGLDRRPPG